MNTPFLPSSQIEPGYIRNSPHTECKFQVKTQLVLLTSQRNQNYQPLPLLIPRSTPWSKQINIQIKHTIYIKKVTTWYLLKNPNFIINQSQANNKPFLCEKIIKTVKMNQKNNFRSSQCHTGPLSKQSHQRII